MPRHSRLQRLYRQYNKQYFRSVLPHAAVSWCPSARMNHLLGEAEYGDPIRIRINSKLRRWDFAEIVLLHEMVHVLLRDRKHSCSDRRARMFNRVMRGLAAKGAFDGLW